MKQSDKRNGLKLSLSRESLQMELRYYQQEAVDAAYAWLRSSVGNPVIVLPTGSGKTPVCAELCKRAIGYEGRVVVITHVKELVEQSEATLSRFGLDCGLYSAGLNRRDLDHDIIVAGIQSIYKKAADLGRRNLVIVDECHRVGRDSESMYGQFFRDLQAINPRIKIVGMSATPYRLDSGAIWSEGGIFAGCCYEANLKRLIDEGYLSNITNEPTATSYDTSSLHTRYGEFIQSEMETLFGDEYKTKQAVEEIVKACSDRHSIIVFCSGVQHALLVHRLLGDEAGLVIGDTPALERAALINGFKNRRIRFLVNAEVLTTGFDAPNIDAIAVIRATMSPGLFAQIAGRGLRKDPSKKDCLLLDFGGNIERHGPLDAIDFGKKKQSGKREFDAGPVKTCPGCDKEVPAGVRECECGFKFPPPEKKYGETFDAQSQVISEPETFECLGMLCSVHAKEGKTPSMRVEYECSRGGDWTERISEWVCFEHQGFARTKAVKWWQERSFIDVPKTIEEAVELADRGAITCPRSVTARREGKWWRIVSVELDEKPDRLQGFSKDQKDILRLLFNYEMSMSEMRTYFGITHEYHSKEWHKLEGVVVGLLSMGILTSRLEKGEQLYQFATDCEATKCLIGEFLDEEVPF